MNTANGAAKPLGYGKRILYCDVNPKLKDPHKLTLNCVQYLPLCLVNIFGARDLYRKGVISIQGNEVFASSKLLFKFDKEFYIIEDNTGSFPAIAAPKETSIKLWHRRLGHLGL